MPTNRQDRAELTAGLRSIALASGGGWPSLQVCGAGLTYLYRCEGVAWHTERASRHCGHGDLPWRVAPYRYRFMQFAVHQSHAAEGACGPMLCRRLAWTLQEERAVQALRLGWAALACGLRCVGFQPQYVTV